MQGTRSLTDQPLMLDGNSVAGLLQEIFGSEMTAAPVECANCGLSSHVGAMLAFGSRMGTVMRCPSCQGVLMRMVELGGEVRLEMRGIACLRVARAVM